MCCSGWTKFKIVIFLDQAIAMIKEGKDPKEMVMEHCQPSCTHWQDKLARCETAYYAMEESDPEKTCMYPMRDYVTCLEACVQPKIQLYLVGQDHGKFFG